MINADQGRPREKAVFLDRDGVLLRTVTRNGDLSVPYSISEAEILEGVPLALSILKDAGFYLFVVTNQPEVARGKISREEVERIHTVLIDRLPWIDRICTCYHDDADNCDCRKPRPGMIERVKEEFSIQTAYMVGDRWRDIEAGRNARCCTIYIDNGPRSGNDKKPEGFQARMHSLLDAACWIIGSQKGGASWTI